MGNHDLGSLKLSRRHFIMSAAVSGASLLAGTRGPGTLAAQGLAAATADELLDAMINLADAELAIDALVEVFARSGIAVFDNAVTAPLIVPSEPVSPLSFQRWQLAAMITEFTSGGSRPAVDYDVMFPPTTLEGDVAPSVGELLTGYYGSGTTPGSQFTKTYFDRLLTDNLVISAADLPASTVIVALLSGEILGQLQQAAGIGASAASHRLSAGNARPPAMAFSQVPATSLPGLPELPPLPSTVTSPLPPIQGGTVCGLAQSFLSTVMQRVFSVLKAAEAVQDIPLIGGILGALLNGVQLGINAITKAVDALLAPVLGIVKAIAGGLAVASMLIGTLSPWTVVLDLRPSRNRFGIDSEVVTGEVGITAGGWDQITFPPVIQECASLAGIDLPQPTATDAPVLVQAVQSVPLMTLQTTALRLNASGQATSTYQTQNESSIQATGEEVIGIAWITGTVEREDLTKLRDSLVSLLFSQLPDLIAGIIRPLVGPVIDQLSNQLIGLIKVSGTQPLSVTFHKPPDTPTPPDEPSPTVTSEATKADGCFPGDFLLADPFVIQRQYIPFPMDVTGTNSWSFAGDGTVHISFDNLVLTLHPDPSAQFTFTFSGTQSGVYTIEGDVLSVQITENNAVMDTDMIALQGQIAGPTPMTGALSGPYTCGSSVVWQVSVPEIGVVPYELVPV